MHTTLLTEISNGTLVVTINRPDKMNALNKDVMNDLEAVITEAERNEEIRSMIITGSGAKAFVAGADISEFVGLSGGEGMDLARRGQEIFFRIENCKKPIVAAVNGFALGGGCELAMACHFRLASENAKFGQPEVNLGLIPGYGGTQRLVQLIGKGRAIEFMLTANMIDAQTALQWGLVNYVLPADQLLEKAKSLLQLIHTKAPGAVARCIASANAVYSTNGYLTEIDMFGECFESEDMKEGTSAFLEKRKPAFTGR